MRIVIQNSSLVQTQVARTAASAVAFAQTCFGSASERQAVAVTMASMNDDKLLRFFDVCPKYLEYKESVEEVLVPPSPFCLLPTNSVWKCTCCDGFASIPQQLYLLVQVCMATTHSNAARALARALRCAATCLDVCASLHVLPVFQSAAK